jgi:predicted nucleic acid-binding protein
MILDSTVLVDMLRDKSGQCRARLLAFLRGNEYFLTRFTQLELLRGTRNEAEWTELASYVNDQYYVEATDRTWPRAARIYFELRKRGQTVRSMIDCCIAQLAIENDLTLIHNDRDFDILAGVRPLRHVRLDLKVP